MMSGTILGVVTGLTYGLLAAGLVLVYKASRFVNLAHGALGALSAVLLASLVLDHGWSWWAALPVVVTIGIVLGWAVERLVVRPLRRQRRRGVTMLLVTIGISQLLLALTYIPAFSPDKSRIYRAQYPLPFLAHWRILRTDLTGAHMMILTFVPAVAAALGAFLRWTTLGKSIRAAASNPDSARLCGISVDRVNALTWAIAGALSALTAVLLAPGQSLFTAGALGPRLLLRALGAAALGGFTSIPWAMIGGLGLGVIEHITLSITSQGTSGELAVFAAVIVVLFARGWRISSTAEGAEETAEDRSPVHIPKSVADRFVVRRHRLLLGLGGIVLAAALPHLPYFSHTENQFLLVLILVFATVGVGLTMLLGWAGQVSLGHFALIGIGAYTAAQLGRHDLSLPFVLLLVGVAGAATMTLVGLPALRLRGLTLAVTTLGFAVAAPAWLFVQPWFGAQGQSFVKIPRLGLFGVGRLGSQLSIYYVALAVLVLTSVTAGALRRSVPGRLIVAARDNDAALASFGVTPATVKLATLAVSGFIAAAAGVIWGAAWSNVSADLVQPAQSLALLVIPVVGGLGSISGAIVAAFLVYMPTYFVGPHLTELFGNFGRSLGFQLALSGAGLALIPLSYPAGVAGMAQRAWERFLKGLDKALRRWRPATPSPDPLVVRDISLSFGGIRALADVSLEVHPGEIVGLIGPNGAGKTTLINVISGHLAPDLGPVLVGGQDVSGLASELRAGFGLGRSFQDARLFPGLTVAEAVQVALAAAHKVGVLSSMLGAPWARAADHDSRREADRLLATMGLTPWGDALTAEISTGMRRMTDLAMQIAARPKVLLLDEPTAGIAQREAEAFGPMLRRIRDELDCSILIVEHDMPLLMGLCDRIYAMETGRIIAVGLPQEIREDPRVVASYLGAEAAAIGGSGVGSGDGHRGDGARRRVGRPVPSR